MYGVRRQSNDQSNGSTALGELGQRLQRQTVALAEARESQRLEAGGRREGALPNPPTPDNQQLAGFGGRRPAVTPQVEPLQTPGLGAKRPLAAGQQDEGFGARPGNRPAPEAGNAWQGTGIGVGRTGGEIAMRSGADGAPEFTNENATPGSTTGAASAQGGFGARRPAASTVGDGVGTFTQLEPGTSQLALERFARANEIRAGARRPQEGNGVRVSVIRDSSRSPTLAEVQNARLEERQAQTEALRARTANESGELAIRTATEQLNQQRLQQQIEEGEQARSRTHDLEGILAGLPGLQGDARDQAEREYLLRADPRAYLEQQAKSGADRVELETKQLERDKLRQELEQGSGGSLKLTEQQSKDLGYYTRGNEANAQLARQGDALTARASGERGQARGIADAVIRGTPLIGDSALGNSLVSTERQQAEQSGREVLAAILRKDTGAAITDQEMKIYGAMYLPQPGDSDAVLNQKAEARTRALESIRGGLGTAERKAAPLADGRRQSGEAGPVRVFSRDDVAALPSGTVFMGPDGIARRKP